MSRPRECPENCAVVHSTSPGRRHSAGLEKPPALAPAAPRARVAGGAEEPLLARHIRSSKRRRQDAYATPRRRRTRTRSRRLSLRLPEQLCSPERTPRCRSSSAPAVRPRPGWPRAAPGGAAADFMTRRPPGLCGRHSGEFDLDRDVGEVLAAPRAFCHLRTAARSPGPSCRGSAHVETLRQWRPMLGERSSLGGASRPLLAAPDGRNRGRSLSSPLAGQRSLTPGKPRTARAVEARGY